MNDKEREKIVMDKLLKSTTRISQGQAFGKRNVRTDGPELECFS